MLASYAVGVALNGFLPANIGSLVMMLMFVTLIAGATFAAIFSGFVVQKIPFTVLSVAVYVYLFATVPGSLSLELGFVSEHPALTAVLVVGAVLLLVLVGRFFWRRATKLRDELKSGGAILGRPAGSRWEWRSPRWPASFRGLGSSPCSSRRFRFR